MQRTLLTVLLSLVSLASLAQTPTFSSDRTRPRPSSNNVKKWIMSVSPTGNASLIPSSGPEVLLGISGAESVSAVAASTDAVVRFAGSDWKRRTGTRNADNVLVIAAAGGFYYQRQVDFVTPQMWRADAGDGLGDDGPAISAAAQSGYQVFIKSTYPNFYKVSDFRVLNAATRVNIQATGARILCADKTVPGWLFQSVPDIKIVGGEWGYSQVITANGGNNQHIFQLDNCQNVTITGATFKNGPEMGIAVTNCNKVNIHHNTIMNTWRDGIYSRFSANVNYSDNTIDNIKDDAISFHDKDNLNPYVSTDKMILNGYGFAQASNAVIERNIISNAVQGIVSVSGAGVKARFNQITNTVNGGITFFNFRNDDPAAIINCEAIGNTIRNAGSTTTINGVVIENFGQATSGRGSISVISLGPNMQISLSNVKRSKNVTIKDNIVDGAGALGMVGYSIDDLNNSGNTYLNCTVAGNTLGGAVVEVLETTGYTEESTNTVIDTRPSVQHVYAYSFSGVVGSYNNWVVRGRTGPTDGLIGNSPNLFSQFMLNITANDLPHKLGFIDSGTSTLDWNDVTYRRAGTWQVAGASVGNAPNAPWLSKPVTNTGTFDVTSSQGTLVQAFVDNVGHRVSRHLNGVTSNNFSAWALDVTDDNLTANTATFLRGATAKSKTIPIGSGSMATLDLSSQFYAIGANVTGTPVGGIAYSLEVIHYEDSALSGGGTIQTWIMYPALEKNHMYIGGRRQDGSMNNWITVY